MDEQRVFAGRIERRLACLLPSEPPNRGATMYQDSRAHAITTDSSTAASAVDEAIGHLVGRRAAMMPTIEAAVVADPACVMAQALAGLMACGARKAAALPAASQALAAIGSSRHAATSRERLYVEALEQAIARRPGAMVARYEAILCEHPTDLLAAVLAQGELFWTGDMPRSARLSAAADSAWHEGVDGYPDWLALRAFDLEEAGELDAAERLGREAIARDPANLWGAHAVSHVLEMRGDSAGGVRWLDGLHAGWDAGGPMRFHLWWHRCLCHVELGESDAALALHDDWLRNDALPFQRAVPDFYLDVQNAASHLLRLEIAGVDVGDRWQSLATAIDASWDDLSSPFTTLHVAMVLAATGQRQRLARLIDAVEALAGSTDPAVAGSVGPSCSSGAEAEQQRAADTLPDAYRGASGMLRAIRAHRAGHHAQVVADAQPLRGELWRFGGSHAQRDVLFQLLFDSARAVGDQALMRAIHADLERIGFRAPFERAAYRTGTRR